MADPAISARASVSLRLSTAMRMTSAPAASSSRTCRSVASMSWVRVAAMLCTATGWPAPMVRSPMRTGRVGFRGRWLIRASITSLPGNDKRWECGCRRSGSPCSRGMGPHERGPGGGLVSVGLARSLNLRKARPHLPEEDLPALLGDFEAILRSGVLTMGPYLERFETDFARAVGVRHAVGMSSGTAPLEVACGSGTWPAARW